MKEDIKITIDQLCNMFSFCYQTIDDVNYKIFIGEIDGITLLLNIDEDKLRYHFQIRTHDVVYEGDRSDIHISISLMFASFLKLKANISCSLFDIGHPAIDNEIWGRYMYPEQYKSHTNKIIDELEYLIFILQIWRSTFWETIGCPCQDCLIEEGIDDNYLDSIDVNLLKYLNNKKMSNYGGRKRPEFELAYDIDDDITIIKSQVLTKYLINLIKQSDSQPKQINGINGNLLIREGIYNYQDFEALQNINKIFSETLKYNETNLLEFIVLENFIIGINDSYIVAKSVDSGKTAFENEKKLIKERHNIEASILFPIPIFEWINNPCPTQFELLIKSLLERDPLIKRVRIAAPTNQGDKGRDLIIDKEIIDKNKAFEQNNFPSKIIKIVGQCKASNNSIGKNKVIDIRDTIENHNANGYFLAVSTQITNPLTESLENLEQKSYWIDWWNRDDIEFLLNQNQDLIPKFEKVLKIKNTIKFVAE